MRHLKPINQKADRVVEHAARQKRDVVALQTPPGARRIFRSAARSCSRLAGKPIRPAAPPDSAQPVERDIFDCHIGCFWPAQVPDQLNHAPNWTGEVRRRSEGLAQARPRVSVRRRP